MGTLEVRAKREVPQRRLILVEHKPHLTHVREAIVVLRTQDEAAEIVKRRYANCVKVPADETETVQMWVARQNGLHHLLAHFWVSNPLEFAERIKRGECGAEYS